MLLFKSVLLVVLALLLVLGSGSAVVFLVAVIASTTVAFTELYQWLAHPTQIRFSRTLSLSILLAYSFGTMIFILVNATLHAPAVQYYGSQGMVYDQNGLSVALAMTLCASSALLILTHFEPALFPNGIELLPSGPAAERLLWTGVAIVVLALVTGSIGYGGVARDASNHISPLGALATMLAPPLVPYAILLLRTANTSRNRKPVIRVALLVLIAVLLVLGRRYLLYVMFLCFFAWSFTGSAQRRRLPPVWMFLAAPVVLYVGFYFFFALRQAVDSLGPNHGLATYVREAWSFMNGQDAATLRDALHANIGSRPFILSYPAGLLSQYADNVPLMGKEAVYSVQSAIPSVLMPLKTASLAPSVEALTHPYYGLPVFDGANTAVTAGLDDFGWIGAILYPMLLTALFILYYKIVRSLLSAPTLAFVSLTLLFQVLYVEQGPSSVFVTIRDLTLVLLIFAVVNVVFSATTFMLHNDVRASGGVK